MAFIMFLLLKASLLSPLQPVPTMWFSTCLGKINPNQIHGVKVAKVSILAPPKRSCPVMLSQSSLGDGTPLLAAQGKGKSSGGFSLSVEMLERAMPAAGWGTSSGIWLAEHPC